MILFTLNVKNVWPKKPTNAANNIAIAKAKFKLILKKLNKA